MDEKLDRLEQMTKKTFIVKITKDNSKIISLTVRENNITNVLTNLVDLVPPGTSLLSVKEKTK